MLSGEDTPLAEATAQTLAHLLTLWGQTLTKEWWTGARSKFREVER